MKTPQEITDYKNSWRPGYAVTLHSDLDTQGKDWCRKNLERWQWSFTSYTDVYEHTFCFEHKHDANVFEQQWPKFTNQNKGSVNAKDHTE